MDDRELLQHIDACRSAADLGDAEMDALRIRLDADPQARACWDAVRRADRALEQAFHAVDVPAGLQARLLAALAVRVGEDASSGAAPDELLTSPRLAAEDRAVRPSALERLATRRRPRWHAMAAALAAALLVAAIPLWLGLRGPRLTAADVEAGVLNYHTALGPTGPVPADAPPASPWIVRSTLKRANAAPDFLGTQAVAYTLRRGRARATLYAAPLEVPGLPAAPPPQPGSSTSGSAAVVAWQEGAVLYVLVVEGGPRDYAQFVRRQQTPVAWAGRHGRPAA